MESPLEVMGELVGAIVRGDEAAMARAIGGAVSFLAAVEPEAWAELARNMWREDHDTAALMRDVATEVAAAFSRVIAEEEQEV